MRQVGKIVVMALVLTLAQGCAEKKAKAKIPPQAQAPATDQTGALYPPPFPEKTETPPVVPEPTKPDVVPAPKPVPQKKPPTKKKSTPANTTTAKTPKPAAGNRTCGICTASVPAPPVAHSGADGCSRHGAGCSERGADCRFTDRSAFQWRGWSGLAEAARDIRPDQQY